MLYNIQILSAKNTFFVFGTHAAVPRKKNAVFAAAAEFAIFFCTVSSISQYKSHESSSNSLLLQKQNRKPFLISLWRHLLLVPFFVEIISSLPRDESC